MKNTTIITIGILASTLLTASTADAKRRKKHVEPAPAPEPVVVETEETEATAPQSKRVRSDDDNRDSRGSGDDGASSETSSDGTSVTESVPAPARSGAKTIGADGAAVLPLGNYGRASTFAVGALGRLEIPQGPGFITARAGVLFHAMNDGAYGMSNGSLIMVPLYGGYRYPMGTSGAYVAGELGITYARVSVATPYGTMSGSDTELGMTLSAGLRKGALDLRGGIIAPSIGDSLGLMASVGYDFAAF